MPKILMPDAEQESVVFAHGLLWSGLRPRGRRS
jgi:hypothetical protein